MSPIHSGMANGCIMPAARATVLLRFHGHIFPFISRVDLAPFHPVFSHSGSEQGSRWLCAPQATGRGRKSLAQGFSQTVQSTDGFCGPQGEWKHYSKASWICILFRSFHFIGNLSKKERAK